MRRPALFLLFALLLFPPGGHSEERPLPEGIVPDLGTLVSFQESPFRGVVERFMTDWSALSRRYDLPSATTRNARREFLERWLEVVREVPPESLGVQGGLDVLLLRSDIQRELALLRQEEQRREEMSVLVDFSEPLLELQEARRRLESTPSREAATVLHDAQKALADLRRKLEAELAKKPGAESTAEEKPEAMSLPSRTVAHRAAQHLDEVRQVLRDWYEHRAGYDPSFDWWLASPFKKLDGDLESFVQFLREQIVGVKPGEDPPIVGDPIGREALLQELQAEWIPYTPEQLLEIARQEMVWCDAELLKASRELGFGEDWQAALEHVKAQHPEPGEQPNLVREFAQEAIAFVEERNLVTIPPLAKEIWRLEMLSAEAQKFAPFFLGGEVIQVAYPTASMSHSEKIMALRGNNEHFSRATVHHELIPGHHLQGFMTSRYHPYRRAFSTPFWMEGWALYWEMVLWDKGFPRSPEDRIGMLFWRRHRCARILFSLGFHLGQMSPEESIDMLVEQVGHERSTATAEVRRSFEGSYSPLYQVAYMMGAIQFRALRQELVDRGKWTEQKFHDAILQGGPMPVELVRARLLGELPEDGTPAWHFAGPVGE